MINFTCPGCKAAFQLPDEIAGKSARCSKCNERFTVPGGAPKPAPAAPPKKVALNPAPEVLEAELVDDAGPPRRAPRRSNAIDEVEVVNDAAIQEPRRPRQPAAARGNRDDDDRDVRRRPDRRDDDDDDDNDDDRPRRKKRRRERGNTLGWLMPTIGGVSGVLCIIFGAAAAVTTAHQNVVVNNPPPFQVNFNQNPPPPIFNQPGKQNPFVIKQNPVGKAPGPVGPARKIQLVNGQFQSQEQLQVNDPLDSVMINSHAKRFAVQLEAGKNYTIDMIRGNPAMPFDPFLRLEHNGVTLLSNDDFGSLDSRIVFRPTQAGEYVVVTTTLFRAVGNYELRIVAGP